jgi:hypothetical protein
MLDRALDLRQDLERERKAAHMASAPSARAYHRAHVDCLKAVGNYNPIREDCDLLKNGIPRPFPFDLYSIRDEASQDFFPYKRELKRLDHRLGVIGKEIEDLKRVIADKDKRPQGTLDL